MKSINILSLYEGDKKKKIVNMILYLLFAITYLMAIFIFAYGDQQYNVKHSILFIDGILHGRILDVYQYYIDMINNGNTSIVFVPVYSPICLLFLGLINTHNVILYELGIIDINSKVISYSAKIELFIVTILAAFFLEKIVGLLCDKKETIEKHKCNYESVTLFLTSSCIIFYAVMLGQMEIFSVLFSLIGLYYWMKDDWKKFIFSFAVAIVFKMYALILLIPLCLIKRKNILSILISLLGGVSIYGVGNIIWSIDKTYPTVTYESGIRMISQMVGTEVCNVSIFLVLYIGLCFLVYISKRDDIKWALYISFLTYSIMYLTVDWAPYFIVCFMPFFPMLIISEDENKKILGYIVQTIFEFMYLIYAIMVKYYFMISPNLCNTLVLSNKNQDGFKYSSLAEMINNFKSLELYYPIFKALWITMIIIMIILISPMRIEVPKLFEKFSFKVLLIVRFLFIIALMVGIIYMYFCKPEPVILSNTESGMAEDSINILDEEHFSYGVNSLIQEISVKNNTDVESILLYFDREHMDFLVYQSLYLEIIDSRNNETIALSRIGVNQLNNDDFTEFKFKNLKFKKDNTYYLRLYTDAASTYSYLYIKTTPGDTIKGRLINMGVGMDADLFMVIKGKN